MKLAYHGEPGAFAEAACALVDADAEPVAHATIAAAIAAVRAGDCDRAVLPVESSVAGPVTSVLSAIPGSGLARVGEVALPIRMALLGLPGANVAKLSRVLSHPVGLAQCRSLIGELGVVAQVSTTTAAAAADVASARDSSLAALGSARAGALRGLVVLRDDVGDDPAAVTRFGVFARATG